MDSVMPGLEAAAHIHPLVVHFPIALWLTALLFWLVATLRDRDALFAVGRWLLYLGTASALVAVGTGLWAAEQLGHDTLGHERVHVHRNWMLVTTGLALVATTAAYLWRGSISRRARWVQLALLAGTAVVMTLGADRGAELVFRHGVGTAADKPATAAGGHDDDHHADGEDHHGGGDSSGHAH